MTQVPLPHKGSMKTDCGNPECDYTIRRIEHAHSRTEYDRNRRDMQDPALDLILPDETSWRDEAEKATPEFYGFGR